VYMKQLFLLVLYYGGRSHDKPETIGKDQMI